MQGSLKQYPLPEVLQFINMGKSTGLLVLRGEDGNEVSLSISNGRIVNSSAIERRRRLGDLLVHRGLIRRSDLKRLLHVQRKIESDKRLGQLLVERDLVSQQTITEVLRQQLEEELWKLFAWEDGDFAFQNTTEEELGEARVMLDIGPLILEGTRRNDEWQRIRQVFPSDDIVLRIREVPEDFNRQLKLKPTEWRVLSAVNGRLSLRGIVNRATFGEFEICFILAQFLRAGLIEIVEDPVADDPSATGSFPKGRPAGDGTPIVGDRPKAGGLLGGLMSLGRGDRRDGANRHSVECVSPLGAVAVAINELVEHAFEILRDSIQTSDRRLLEDLWRDLSQTYVRADLVRVKGNRVDVSALEAWLVACEFRETLDDCYEDSLEGLTALVEQAWKRLQSRLGDRNAAKVARETSEALEASIVVKNRGPFSIGERLRPILGTESAA